MLRKPGVPLDPETRLRMERRLGHDLSHVRLHTDDRAANSARAVNAEAYTVGSSIVWGGRYKFYRPEGRRLLAHELVHTIQQRGARAGNLQQLALGSSSSSAESEAQTIASAMLAGSPAGGRGPVPVHQHSGPTMLMRQPAQGSPARRKIPVTVIVDKPISGSEFCVRAVMLAYGESHAQAEARIATDHWIFHGRHAVEGIGEGELHKPIRFVLEDHVRQGQTEGAGDSSAEESRAVQQALATPRMRRFMSIRGAVARGRRTQALKPGEARILLAVAKEVEQLSDQELSRYARLATGGSGSWAETLAGLQRLRAAEASDRRLSASVSEDAPLIELIKAHRKFPAPSDPLAQAAWLENERQLTAALAAKDFQSLDDYERFRARPWREAFRARAIEVANVALRRARESAEAMRRTAADQKQVSLMFDRLAALRYGTGGMEGLIHQVLIDYPILRHHAALERAMHSPDRHRLSSRMGLQAVQMVTATIDIAARLERDPDRVFQMDTVVAATLREFGLSNDSPQAQIIFEGIGEERDDSFLGLLLSIADFLEYFIPGVGEVKAIGNFLGEVNEYEMGTAEAMVSVRSEAPSIKGMVIAGAAPFAPMVFGRVLSALRKVPTSELRGLGDVPPTPDPQVRAPGAPEAPLPVSSGGPSPPVTLEPSTPAPAPEPTARTPESNVPPPEPPVTQAEPPVTQAKPPVTQPEPPVTQAEPPVTQPEPPITPTDSPAAEPARTPKPRPRSRVPKPPKAPKPSAAAETLTNRLGRFERRADRFAQVSPISPDLPNYINRIRQLILDGKLEEASARLSELERGLDVAESGLAHTAPPGSGQAQRAELEELGELSQQRGRTPLQNVEGLRLAPELPADAPELPMERWHLRQEPPASAAELAEQQSILANPNRTEGGVHYEEWAKRRMTQETPVVRPGRRPDIGDWEITLEGMDRPFAQSSRKLRQLWLDLVDRRGFRLVVPRLSPEAAVQIRQMAAAAEVLLGEHVTVEVVETLP